MPNNGSGKEYEVTIDQASLSVTMDISPTINTLDNRNTLSTGAYTLTLAEPLGLGNYGTIDVTAPGGTSSIVGNVENMATGQISTTAATTFVPDGPWHNDGTVSFAAGSVLPVKTWAISGDGEMALDGTLLNGIVTSGTTHTIRGAGELRGTLTTDGTIIADDPKHTSPLQLTADTTNTGVLRAEGGRLEIRNTVVENSGGTIEPKTGGAVAVVSSLISNGKLTGVGVCEIGSSSRFENVSVQDVTLRFDDASGAALLDASGSWSDCQVELFADSANATLRAISGNLTLSGTGALSMRDGAGQARLVSNGGTLTNNAEHTIQGSGTIEVALVSNGTVVANDAARPLVLAGNAKTNNGMFTAEGGGRLEVMLDVGGTGGWEADGGEIVIGAVAVTTTGSVGADSGGTLELNDASMTGDSLHVYGSSSVLAQGGSTLSTGHGWIAGSGGPASVVTVDGATTSWTTNGAPLCVGRGAAGNAVLNIRNGGEVTSGESHIGYSAGSGGLVMVDNGVWSTAGSAVFVGAHEGGEVCAGTLVIDNGGQVHSGAATIAGRVDGQGDVSVTGSASAWDTNAGLLQVGGHGAATLSIAGGATVSSGACDIAGTWADGTVTVEGSDGGGNPSTLDTNSGELRVGLGGNGRLEIRDGGRVLCGDVRVRGLAFSPEDIVVDGVDSRWQVDGTVLIGDEGTTVVKVTRGVVTSHAATVASVSGGKTLVTIGSEAGGYARWTIDGPEGLAVGGDGLVSMDVFPGATLSSTTVSIAPAAGTAGTVEVDGRLTSLDSVYVGGDGSSSGGTAQLRINDGSTTSIDDTLRVWDDGTVHVAGGETTVGSLVVVAGSLRLWDPAARLTIGTTFRLGAGSRLSAQAGAQVHMTHANAFQNESTNASELETLRSVELIFEGRTLPAVEVAGEDRNARPCGLRSNFALGTLTLSELDVAHVRLADVFDNQLDGASGNEALYVENLNIGNGCLLDLSGLKLYYLNAMFSLGATIVGGTLEPIYVPNASCAVDGVPNGYPVDAAFDDEGSGGLGTAGMAGGSRATALSGTAELDEGQVSAAAAAAPGGYITLKIYYDEDELARISHRVHDKQAVLCYNWCVHNKL